MITVDTSHAAPFLPETWLESRLDPLARAAGLLERGDGAGGEFTGWVHLPRQYDRMELERVKKAAEHIRSTSQVLVVIGIGGSYLGARAVIELLGRAPGAPEICFAGNTLSTDAALELFQKLEGRDFSVNVISKSGTTTEPAVAFRLFKALTEARYGKQGARQRIFATTDARRGALKALAEAEGYECFVVPDNIGGRYSVLTTVGLLPTAAAGIDIDALLSGAAQAMAELALPGEGNPAWRYAAARSGLYHAGKKVEVLACYEPSARFFAEWWKQLYGESEGKQGRGIFPASVEFTADLHSMGQYLQQGERFLFESVVKFRVPRGRLPIPHDPADADGLNFLAGRQLDFVAEQAFRGTLLAHVDGGVPNLVIQAERREATDAGQLLYFFEYACGLSGYLLGVNPFDQPGVEAYKQNMFALLGKPGYEERRAQLEARL